jgi:CPA2 family monovalent cation:H+ antiporter-2
VADIVLGILIVEDLIAILLIAILTAVGEGEGMSPRGVVATTLQLALFLAGLVGIGLLTVPRLIRAAVSFERAETLLVASMGVCFAASLLALSLGYSVALGAFIAGALVSESGHEKAVEHLVTPVRDLFVAIFFVAVGMQLDPMVIIHYWWLVVALVFVVIGGKVLAVSSGVFLTGAGLRPAVQAGMSLAQIGEFSFIIASIGLATGSTRDFLYPVAVAVSAITTLTTPALIRSARRVAIKVDARLPGPLQTFVALYGSWMEGLRANPSRPGGRSRTKKLVRVIAIDTLLLAVLFIGLSVEFPRLVRLFDVSLGLSRPLARAIVMIGGAALAAPLLWMLVRSTHLLGLAISVRALPMPEAKKVGHGARAASRARNHPAVWIAVRGGRAADGRRPAVRAADSGTAVQLAAGLILLAAIWRSAKNLQGHALAGGEVIAAALSRRMTEGAGCRRRRHAEDENDAARTR